MEPRLDQETIDYIAIRRLQSAYADIVTRRAWPELFRIFRPDIEVVIDRMDGSPLHCHGPEAVSGFISKAIAHFDLFEFVILNTVIEIDGDQARSRMWMWEARHDPAAGRSDAFGLYRDEHRRIDGRWWFTGRRYQTLARTLVPDCTVFPQPAGMPPISCTPNVDRSGTRPAPAWRRSYAPAICRPRAPSAAGAASSPRARDRSSP